MELYKTDIKFKHLELYYALKELSALKKSSGSSITAASIITSYSFGRQAGHTEFIVELAASNGSVQALCGRSQLRQFDKEDIASQLFLTPRDFRDRMVFSTTSTNLVVDKSHMTQEEWDLLYIFIEENWDKVHSVVVIGT